MNGGDVGVTVVWWAPGEFISLGFAGLRKI